MFIRLEQDVSQKIMRSMIELGARKRARRPLSRDGPGAPGLCPECMKKHYPDLEEPGRQSP